MFETSAVPAHAQRGVLARSFPVSVTLHGFVIFAWALAMLWEVNFPEIAPGLSVAYVLTELPTPPPPPPPPAAAPRATLAPVTTPTGVFAPTSIPDVIPLVQFTPAPVQGIDRGVVGGVAGGVPEGVIGGEAGGVIGGVLGGIIGGIISEPHMEGNRMVFPRDYNLPLIATSQVYPNYPEDYRIKGVEGSLIVRYVIGVNGRVTNVEIIHPCAREKFNDAAVAAIRHWRFRPYLADGKPVEVSHELTVYFRLVPTG
jgi:protein TonB